MEPGALLGAGKTAEIREWTPGWVIKLSRTAGDDGPARREADILKALAPLGVAPRTQGVIECAGQWGVVIERVPGPVLGALVAEPGRISEILAVMRDLHLRVHRFAAPEGLPRLTDRLARNIDRAPQLDEPLRRELLQRLGELPDGDRLCHGDFHPYNIMGEGAAARIIDWLDASAGDPLADVCRTYVLISSHDIGLARTYADKYAQAAGVDPGAILRWVPVVAAARLAEDVPEETERLLAMARGR